MKRYSSYIKFLVAFGLTLIPALVLAQDLPPSSPLWDMFYNLSLAPSKTDMSVSYLAKIFGEMPGVPQLAGTGSTVIGAIFGVFNAGVLALSGVFLCYTITRIVTETTMDGGAMGKSTTIWTAIRCALSTSLLVPQASGYSMVNGVVMWVVMQSIGLANATWGHALDYLSTGGPLYATQSPAVDYTLINYDLLTGNKDFDDTAGTKRYATKIGSADVLRSLVCSYAVFGALQENQKANYQRLSDKRVRGDLSYAEQREYSLASKSIPERSEDVFSIYRHVPASQNGANNGYFVFPYVHGEATDQYPLKNNFGLRFASNKFLPKLTGVCGAVTYNIVPPGNLPKEEERALISGYNDSKQNGLESMINILSPVAKQLLDKTRRKEDGSPSELDPDTYSVAEDIYFVDPANITKYADPSYQNIFSKFYLKIGNKVDTTGTTPNKTEIAKRVIKWPFGADEMLTAAANYQLLLSDVRKRGASTLTGKIKQQFEESKKLGWVSAGGYYRLLVSQQKDVALEKSHYRLTNYDIKKGERTEEANEDEARRVRANDSLYATLLETQESGNKLLSIAGIETIEGGQGVFKPALEKALKWIYLSYPYGKLRGQVLSALATEQLGKIGGEKTKQLLEDWAAKSSRESMQDLTKAWGLLFTGSVLLTVGPIIPPAWLAPLFMWPKVPVYFLTADLKEIVAKWGQIMADQKSDPIIKLQQLGLLMIDKSQSYITQLFTFTSVVTGSVSLLTSLLGIASIAAAPITLALGAGTGVSVTLETYVTILNSVLESIQATVFMWMPLGLSLLGPLLVSGIVFAVYVPFIPYLLFVFGAISWLISILVLMAASPIICFLMLWGNSSQENPLLAREAEQFVMQVVGIFFRPTLMVIGLIAGVVLSYIGVDILNLGFGNIAEYVYNTSTGLTQLIIYFGLIIVYTFAMVSVVNMCFAPIHLLYSEVMSIVGIRAPAVGLEERQIEAAKAALTEFTQAAAGGAREVGGTRGSIGRAKGPGKLKDKEEEKGKVWGK